MVWGVGGFCDVESAIFRILRLFLVMMSLRKKYLFLATLKGYSDPPPSPITVKPIFFVISDPKMGGGSLTLIKARPVGLWEGGGGVVRLCHIYIYPWYTLEDPISF